MLFGRLTDGGMFDALCVLIGLVGGGFAVYLVLRLLQRSRPDLRIGVPIALAFGLRVLAATGVGQLNIAGNLRGGDEFEFLGDAKTLSSEPLLGSDSLGTLTGKLHTFFFSLHFRVLDLPPPQNMMRFEMIAFAVIGLVLLSAAVYELAGAKAGLIAAWLLAFEPANIFFSGLLHKEPLMLLAEGLVTFGGANLWRRGKMIAFVPIVLGCLIAVATRPYVGWFLLAAAAAVVLHASLTRQQGLRSLALVATVILFLGAFIIPFAWEKSSKKNLTELQASQDSQDTYDSNLSLERIDYSTREKLILNMPKRVYDVTFRPYLWEAGNTSQQLGMLGTLVVLACVALLFQALWRDRSAVMQRAAPLVYPAAFMLAAYSLSAGNAGTAYRYRTHIVALALCLIVVLRVLRSEEQAAATRRYVARVLASSPARQPVA